MSMNPPGSNEPPQAPGQGGPPGYTPPGGGFTPPGGSTPPPGGGFTPPGGGFTPPGGGFTPPGGGFTPPGGGFAPQPGGGFQPPMGGGGFGGPGGQLAEWPQRALGGLIDYVGPAILVWILAVAVRSFAVTMLLWLLSLGWGAYNGFLNGSTGQSVGKKMIGLKVVGEQGQLLGGGMGVARWAIAFVAGSVTCGLFYLVDLLFPLWDPKKQTLHDKAVKSLVIVLPK